MSTREWSDVADGGELGEGESRDGGRGGAPGRVAAVHVHRAPKTVGPEEIVIYGIAVSDQGLVEVEVESILIENGLDTGLLIQRESRDGLDELIGLILSANHKG